MNPLLGLIDITPVPIALQLGPLTIPWYGIGYAAALALGAWLADRRARERGENPEHIANGIILVFALGLIGARLYSVADTWSLYASDPIKVLLPPYTGLAIYGGVIGGLVGMLIYGRRHHLNIWRWADIAVPSLFFGQAIARWGNFFNQELYGPPTNLPWGIAIDCAHRVPEYSCSLYPFATTGFQPMFFYESALDFAGGLVALYLSRRIAGWLRDGDLVSFWLIWYGTVRGYLETFRSAYDQFFFGVSIGIIFSVVAVVLGIVLLIWRHHTSASEAAAWVQIDQGVAGSTGQDPGPGPSADAGSEGPR